LSKVIFKHSEQAYIYKKLLDAVNQVCADFKKDALCVAGYRSLECQKATNAGVLAKCKTNYQKSNGAVYNAKGQCLASPYGQSNHCFCIALDFDGWVEDLTNAHLKKYGLVKPMDYEPWHVTLIELVGISDAKKKAIRDSVLNKNKIVKDDEDMTIKEFQSAMNLTADGIVGTGTKAKAKEVLQVCQEILGLNYSTAEATIKGLMSSPDRWLAYIKKDEYFDDFVMNMVKGLGGTL